MPRRTNDQRRQLGRSAPAGRPYWTRASLVAPYGPLIRHHLLIGTGCYRSGHALLRLLNRVNIRTDRQTDRPLGAELAGNLLTDFYFYLSASIYVDTFVSFEFCGDKFSSLNDWRCRQVSRYHDWRCCVKINSRHTPTEYQWSQKWPHMFLWASVVGMINEVNQHRTRWVFIWVTVFGRVNHLGM